MRRLAAAHAGRRLVEQDHRRVAGDRHADLERPLLGVGEHARRRIAARGHPDLLERALGALAHVGEPAHAAPERVAIAERPQHAAADVLVHRKTREDVRDLEAARQSAPIDPVRRAPGDLLAPQADRARRRRELPAHQVEERRLAGAVRADDGVPLALRDTERDAADDRRRAEALAHVAQLERERGRRR